MSSPASASSAPGVIMKEGVNIRGLDTAATLWCSAAVGAAAGAALLIEAATLTGLVIAGNTLLRPLVNAINRIPLDEAASEANYQVRLTATPEHAAEAREALVEALESAQTIRSPTSIRPSAATILSISSPTLVATSVLADELDAIATRLERTPGVEHATWESVAAG